MKNLLKNFLQNLKKFFKDKINLFLVLVNILFNLTLWLVWALQFAQNSRPFVVASGIVLLNLVLAILIYPKDKLSSYLLLGTALLISTLAIILFRFLYLTSY